jgi:hypothetical protein
VSGILLASVLPYPSFFVCCPAKGANVAAQVINNASHRRQTPTQIIDITRQPIDGRLGPSYPAFKLTPSLPCYDYNRKFHFLPFFSIRKKCALGFTSKKSGRRL